jgi:hypothetical protein
MFLNATPYALTFDTFVTHHTVILITFVAFLLIFKPSGSCPPFGQLAMRLTAARPGIDLPKFYT